MPTSRILPDLRMMLPEGRATSSPDLHFCGVSRTNSRVSESFFPSQEKKKQQNFVVPNVNLRPQVKLEK